MTFRLIFFITMICAASACASQPSDVTETKNSDLFIRGTARVVSVNAALGRTVLEIEGREVNAFWQIETSQAQGGLVYRESPLTPPVGRYQEPTVHEEQFPALPGDTIVFVGMKTGKEIFLRGVQVLTH